jgi:hypothetical protein
MFDKRCRGPSLQTIRSHPPSGTRPNAARFSGQDQGAWVATCGGGNGRQLPLGYETQRAATRANWEYVRELTKGSQPSGKS